MNDIAAFDVVAGVVRKGDRVLIARRAHGNRAGLWEFPGGKVADGETHAAALARELREELGVAVTVGAVVAVVCHTYPDRIVRLHAYEATLRPDSPEPAPHPNDHDALLWALPGEIDPDGLCEADIAVLAALNRAAVRPRDPATAR